MGLLTHTHAPQVILAPTNLAKYHSNLLFAYLFNMWNGSFCLWWILFDSPKSANFGSWSQFLSSKTASVSEMMLLALVAET